MDTIEVADGVALVLEIIGAGDPLIVPMGYRDTGFERLARSHRVVMYYPRGRGRSHAVDPSLVTFEHDLADLERIRAELGFPVVSLLGWSYNGGLVARYAMTHSSRVANLVLVGSIGVRCDVQAIHDEQTRRLHAVAPRLMSRLKAGVPVTTPEAQALGYAIVLSRSGRTPPWPDGRHQALLETFVPGSPGRRSNFRILRDLVQTMGAWDWRADACRIQGRVLVIYGAADLLPQSMCANWLAAVPPNSRGLILDGVGHFPSLEDPDGFFPVVDRFLGGEWPAAAFRPETPGSIAVLGADVASA